MGAMFALTATSETRGLVDDDYGFTIDGELVAMPFLECHTPECGCSRGWAGLSSRKATTTAMVTQLPHLEWLDYRATIIDHWDSQLPDADLAGDPAYVAEIDAFIDGIQQIGEQLGEGVIVRREPGGKLVLAMPPTRPRRV